MNHTAVVLSAFGTSTAARDTYEFVEDKFREWLGIDKVFWAFTSRTLCKQESRRGGTWQGPEKMFRTLADEGYTRAVIQSLHIVSGIEYEKIRAAAAGAPLKVGVGMPLLNGEIDCRRTLDALSEHIPDTAQYCTVFAGHGTPHSGAGSLYMQFEECVRSRYPENVYVSMVEGIPSWETTLKKIKQSTVSRVKIIPFMFVAGEHVAQDIMGDGEDSWKNQLTGYHVDVAEKGLGFNEPVLRIYCDHLKKALKETA